MIVDRFLSVFEKEHLTSPQFSWLGFVSPHLPYHRPPIQLHSYDQLTEVVFSATKNQQIAKHEFRLHRYSPHVVPYFNAMLQALDTEIKRLVESVKTATKRHVIFVFLGDNGTSAEVYPNWVDNQYRAKASLYDGGTRVPLMVWSTDAQWTKQHAGEYSNLLHLVDIFPSLASIAGVSDQQIKADENTIDGVSFAQQLSDSSIANHRTSAYLQRGNTRKMPFAFAAVNHQDKKLILREFSRQTNYAADNIIEFYDLNQDPDELNNLFPQLCGDNIKQLWALFDYIAVKLTSTKNHHVEFDSSRYRQYIEQNLLIHKCDV
jgi:arylsulfatase A-like enzyme